MSQIQPVSNESLAQHTTFKVGGVAENFFIVHEEDELVAALRFAQQNAAPLYILGGGSNILASDAGISGVVIQIALKGLIFTETPDAVFVHARAGEVFDEVVAETVQRSWWGLENLSHIPGTIGATPIQNVGAYGVEVADVIENVEAVHTKTGERRIFKNAECDFSYRNSFFKTKEGRSWIVTAVSFILSKHPAPKLSYKDLATRFVSVAAPTQAEIREAIISIRNLKFPDWTTVGTAGSFFQNPIIPVTQYEELQKKYSELPGYPTEDGRMKIALGYVLDKILGLKGFEEGGVGCFAGQALVVYQNGTASAADVRAFAEYVAGQVKEKTDIDITWEVTYWGDDLRM